MISSRHLLATTIAFSLAADPSSARVKAVGFVSHADRAYIGEALASPGSSVYDGDRLSTEADGSLRLTVGTAALHLAPQTSLTVHLPDSGRDTEVELAAGALAFSSAKPPAIAVRANAAWIRCAATFPVAAHISIVNPKELRILARHGSLQFTYKEESAVIPEGVAYRVLLDPEDDPANTSASSSIGQNSGTGKPFLFYRYCGGRGCCSSRVYHHRPDPQLSESGSARNCARVAQMKLQPAIPRAAPPSGVQCSIIVIREAH